jgi:uncharacterized protein YgbK (DUF1537 family)
VADIAFYGDDVTGSVDVLLQFERFGLSGRLFVGTPDAASLGRAAAECDVVGIAGMARSLTTGDLAAEVEPALRALARIDPAIVQYKACSTADSSPAVGSLGRVIEIGRAVFGDRPVPLLFAQPDFGRYTVFGHHFAAEGGAVHRLDRQPTMSTHPTTPMHESDLALHVSRQTTLPIGALPFTMYTSGAGVADALRGSADAAVVLDALDDEHLALVGEALHELAGERHPLFVIGSGGLSRALAHAWRPGPVAAGPILAAGSTGRTAGPVLVVSGSLSPQTRRQTDAAARAGWHVRDLPLEPSGIDAAAADAISALRSGRSVVLASEAAASPAGDVLAAVAGAAASVALSAVRAGVTSRVIVCGGDTSGAVVRLLDISSVSIVANPEGNVVLLRAEARDPAVDGLELLLKGGQVGGVDLFVRLAGLAVPDPQDPS